jgi:hypothetical protein
MTLPTRTWSRQSLNVLFRLAGVDTLKPGTRQSHCSGGEDCNGSGRYEPCRAD